MSNNRMKRRELENYFHNRYEKGIYEGVGVFETQARRLLDAHYHLSIENDAVLSLRSRFSCGMRGSLEKAKDHHIE
jgi:hypothetical protein